MPHQPSALLVGDAAPCEKVDQVWSLFGDKHLAVSHQYSTSSSYPHCRVQTDCKGVNTVFCRLQIDFGMNEVDAHKHPFRCQDTERRDARQVAVVASITEGIRVPVTP